MKAFYPILLLLFFIVSSSIVTNGKDTRAGFYMPDSLRETSMTYRSLNNLIILAVTINNNLQVNLIMDTGCRNLVLFGKKFQSKFTIDPTRKVNFSGLGDGKAIDGALSLGNAITIGSIQGEGIPVVIVPSKNIFSSLDNIDGVIGYDLFIRFEIELNPAENRITFRPALLNETVPDGYTQIPVRIEDSRPVLNTSMILKNVDQQCDVMIDTGSSLGLLLKTTDLKKFKISSHNTQVGYGFNGSISAYETTVEKLILPGYDMNFLPASITKSSWHNYASLGMDILKDYSLVINYCKEYIGLKRL